jgi:hypothetical protein
MATSQGQTQAGFLNNMLATSIAGSSANELNQNAGLSLGALGTGYGQARTDVTNQFQPSLSALGTGFDQARSDITGAYAPAMDATRAGIAQYQPWINSGTSADAMYGNALGLNGAGGNAAATAAFQAGPQYGWARDQAIDAAARKASSLGAAGSGNTLSAITTLGEHLAAGEYGNWLTNLNNASSRGLTAASGAAQGNYNLANLGVGQGHDLGNIDTSRGTATAGLMTGYGSSLGNLDTGLGTGQANIYTGLGNSLAGVNNNFLSTLSQNNTNAGQAQDAANAANQAATRSWAGLGVQALGVGLAPFTGGTSMLGTLGNGAFSSVGGINPFGNTSGIRGA